MHRQKDDEAQPFGSRGYTGQIQAVVDFESDLRASRQAFLKGKVIIGFVDFVILARAMTLMPVQSSPKPLSSYGKYRSLTAAPFLPMSRAEMEALGWDACDVILVSGDAYIDHPSFGAALIGLAQGQSIDWEGRDGRVRRLTVESVEPASGVSDLLQAS